MYIHQNYDIHKQIKNKHTGIDASPGVFISLTVCFLPPSVVQ